MIIFYNKKTGAIVGTIDGRIHNTEHLKMWIGDKNETERIISRWVPDEATRDKSGNVDFMPEGDQINIFVELDKNPSSINQYKVDTKTKKLVKND